MTPEAEDLCNQIGQQIINAIPEAWETAWVTVKFEPGVVSAQGFYKKHHNTAQYNFRVVGAINRLFARLRELIRKDEQDMWAKATFTIQEDKTFKVDFEYEQ